LGNSKRLVLPVFDLSRGLHTIRFSARDNEGNWSMAHEMPLLVADRLYQGYLPAVGR
jgi:hypothetical protein